MASYRTEPEEEALFQNYPYTLYFVQSPSTPSHANSNINTTAYHDRSPDAHMGYSSSRSSKLGSPDFDRDRLHKPMKTDRGLEEESAEEEEEGVGFFGYFTFSYLDSGWWVLVQLGWRFLVSLGIAILVFYIAAKPPPPKLSLKIAGIRPFRLGEGVDGTGVSTKLLSLNCSMDLIIDNNSKLFALRIHPPIIELLFGHLPLAISQGGGEEVYAGSNDITILRLNIGTRDKALYGAGRNMEDLLESGEGLPLVLRVGLRSSFHVVWGIFVSKSHEDAQCLVVLSDEYDKRQRTQVYNSTCIVYS